MIVGRRSTRLGPTGAQGRTRVRIAEGNQGGSSMGAKGLRRGLATVSTVVLGLAVVAHSWAQGMFYREVAKDGRIYVFAIGNRYEAFEKSGGAELGVAVSRRAYINVTGNTSDWVSYRVTPDVAARFATTTAATGLPAGASVTTTTNFDGSAVIRLKYAFGQVNFDKVTTHGTWVRIGQQQTP